MAGVGHGVSSCISSCIALFLFICPCILFLFVQLQSCYSPGKNHLQSCSCCLSLPSFFLSFFLSFTVWNIGLSAKRNLNQHSEQGLSIADSSSDIEKGGKAE